MAIPALDDEGYLPPGVHVATMQEIEEAFGQFRTSSCRPRLFSKLQEFVKESKATGLVEELIVDGSFVTDAVEPNDIDLIVVLRSDHNFAAELRPFQYNVVSKRRVRKKYQFDVLTARQGTVEYEEYSEFFQQIRGRTDRTKGILKVVL